MLAFENSLVVVALKGEQINEIVDYFKENNPLYQNIDHFTIDKIIILKKY
jgi:hypothetical protein